MTGVILGSARAIPDAARANGAPRIGWSLFTVLFIGDQKRNRLSILQLRKPATIGRSMESGTSNSAARSCHWFSNRGGVRLLGVSRPKSRASGSRFEVCPVRFFWHRGPARRRSPLVRDCIRRMMGRPVPSWIYARARVSTRRRRVRPGGWVSRCLCQRRRRLRGMEARSYRLRARPRTASNGKIADMQRGCMDKTARVPSVHLKW